MRCVIDLLLTSWCAGLQGAGPLLAMGAIGRAGRGGGERAQAAARQRWRSAPGVLHSELLPS